MNFLKQDKPNEQFAACAAQVGAWQCQSPTKLFAKP